MFENRIELIADILSKKGWKIERQRTEICDLPEPVINRYKNFPKEWINFITSISNCTNADETVWFLCLEDFKRQGDDIFRWNEFEIMSLQAASDDGDTEWQNDIRKFWDTHLPIVLSARGEYEYYAICMDSGCIVHGFGPEFEEAKEVASSFIKFIEAICTEEIRL